jgi:hypothetical protein
MYAHQAKNYTAERHAAEIRVRAERKFAQLYQAGPKAKGGRPTENPSDATSGFEAPTLAELGVTYDQSSQWQKLAQLSDPEFEAALADEDNRRCNESRAGGR